MSTKEVFNWRLSAKWTTFSTIVGVPIGFLIFPPKSVLDIVGSATVSMALSLLLNRTMWARNYTKEVEAPGINNEIVSEQS